MSQAAPDYAFRVQLALPYAEAIPAVTQALAAEGFGVLTEIDVKATLKKKLDLDFRDYVILGACNPQLAFSALSSELEVGLLLPCNVIVYDAGKGGSTVSIVDPIAMLAAAGNEGLRPVAEEARVKLARVAAALGA